jgi:hypothetical protein
MTVMDDQVFHGALLTNSTLARMFADEPMTLSLEHHPMALCTPCGCEKIMGEMWPAGAGPHYLATGVCMFVARKYVATGVEPFEALRVLAGLKDLTLSVFWTGWESPLAMGRSPAYTDAEAGSAETRAPCRGCGETWCSDSDGGLA